MITVKRIISTVSNSNSHSEPEAGTMAENKCVEEVEVIPEEVN